MTPSVGAALEVSGLMVTLDGSSVVVDVSLCVGSGEVLTLPGPNGAGKSVLLRAVRGALKDDGSIHRKK